MTYSELITIITESSQLDHKQSVARSYEPQLYQLLTASKPLKAITGIRRSGKSFLLKKMYHRLVNELGVPQTNIFFVNFENDRLVKYRSLTGLRNMYEMFLSSADNQKPIYLFLDEIQNVYQWESFVRTIYDSTDYNVFITGSNSRLLSSEFSTSLGGRILEFHIFPFSFKEFLQWHNVPVPNNIFQLSKDKSRIQNFLNQYLRFGGLVETFNLTNEQKVSYQETLIEKIIINDILKRFNLKYPDVLKSIGQFLQTNVGNITSVRNITKWVRNLGEEKKLDFKTVQIYIEYLEKTYLINKVKKFSYKLPRTESPRFSLKVYKKQQKTRSCDNTELSAEDCNCSIHPRFKKAGFSARDYKTKQIFSTQNKYYFTDNLFCQKSDMEDQIENVVFQHFGRSNVKDIYYGRDQRGHEIDFVITDQLQAFQVCYQLHDANVTRETKSLDLFHKFNQGSIHSLYVIYMYDQRTLKHDLPNIKLTSLDQFLLNI